MGEGLSKEDIERLLDLEGDGWVMRVFEAPAVIATLLRLVPLDVAAAVLNGLPAELKRDVVLAVITVDRDSVAVLDHAEQLLVDALRGLRRRAERTPPAAGVDELAELLWAVDRRTERVVVEALASVSPGLAGDVAIRMVQFEAVADLDDRAVQTVLREVELFTLARALHGADEDVLRRFLDNMSGRAAEMLREDLASMRPPSRDQADHARKQIASLLVRLATAGRIDLPDRLRGFDDSATEGER